ncbi:hypothetical protein CC86DRAFT_324045 [Ophiobolus disseminans]|uniref:Uncharacterized protein n=1 Tax=Ophiobolus disseminans TaxID=1469910 RepID=A0A6A6ZXJ0_9PLEO|nr:hypothetical protein CC86DRAFT_324045 [Ophiobolus disseminans]
MQGDGWSKMATGLDELIDVLLSEIALCGTEGAGSADFRRFIHNFYQAKYASEDDRNQRSAFSQDALGLVFYEKTWNWVVTNPDIRILHNNEVQHYSLVEFETAEQHEGNLSRVVSASTSSQQSSSSRPVKVSPADSLIALSGELRKRLSTKKSDSTRANGSSQSSVSSPTVGYGDAVQHVARRFPRKAIEQSSEDGAIFDDPSTTVAAPRLYASQGRIWQALTGHCMDLKKVPTMEFALLSLIAANGPTGITQPELTQFSGQDKRSVPHRTDELARKGYIVKKPVQAGKARTSLCIHSKFISNDHFTTSGAMEDVFQEGQFVASSFALLLYNAFKDAGVVLTRDIRKRLGVPMRTWNKRAVQGALIRLDQTGMIKRFRIRKNKTEDSWTICIRVLREPRPEDIDNLGFKRQTHIVDAVEEQLQDDVDGDTFMRDLEVDMLDNGEKTETNHNLDEDVRIPPQWTPERLLSNVIFEFVTMGRTAGWDSIVLRDRVVGPFWRRPTESYLTRLTDDWERTQPLHLRHLAIIRDTRNTEEKKFVHYVYRTYEHFQQAVAAGEAIWAGVTKPVSKNKKPTNTNLTVDSWGFHGLNQKDFVRFNGTATLSDVRSGIFSRKNGPRWDIALAEEIGYRKMDIPIPKIAKTKILGRPKRLSFGEGAHDGTTHKDEDQASSTPTLDGDSMDEQDEISHPFSKSRPSKAVRIVLTLEERAALGLKTTGRLSNEATEQILAHRQATGDPTSLPDTITVQPVERNGHAPLLTREERIAAGLPATGRLGLRLENELREQRGLPKLAKKPKRKSTKPEATVLSQQQRKILGFNEHGRLHQHFIDALRKEQANDIPLEGSPAVEAYREFLKAEAAKEATRKARKAFFGSETPEASQPASDVGLDTVSETPRADTKNQPSSPVNDIEERKASGIAASPSVSKKQRIDLGSPHQDTSSASARPNSPLNDSTAPTELSRGPTSVEVHSVGASVPGPQIPPQKPRQVSKTTSFVKTPRQPVQSDQATGGGSGTNAIARVSPGVYVYASAKRKGGRGRPRNAFIVVFRSPRLSDLPNFTPEMDSGYEYSNTVSMGALKAPIAITAGQGKEVSNVMSFAGAPVPPQTPAVHPDTAIEPDVLAHASQKVDPELSGLITGDQLGAATDFAASATKAHAESSGSLPQQSATIDSVVVEPEVDGVHGGSQLRSVAGWNTNSSSAQVTKAAYQSPYAPMIRSNSSTPVPRLDDSTIMHTSMASNHEISGSEAHGTASLPQGIISPIAEENDIVAPKRTKGRGAGPGIAGSQRSFRRAIILEIIDRCGGVFPLHGEIWRPFSAIWDQRHGGAILNKPGSTAVSDTLTDMIREPSFGLTRMRFRVEARNAVGSKERCIVAKMGMTPHHPTVQRLAYGMANHALEKSHQYYPKEVRDLFEYQSSYVPLPIAPKDESVTVEQIYPRLKESKEQRAKERREQKKRERAAAKQRNKEVEQTIPKRRKQAEAAPREKRTRLASLNDKARQYRWAPVQGPGLEFVEAPSNAKVREPSPEGTDSSEDIPLTSLRPSISDIVDCGGDDDESPPSNIEDDDIEATDNVAEVINHPFLALETVTFTHPVVVFHASTGTFSTNFAEPVTGKSAKSVHRPPKASRTKKRVRIDTAAMNRPSKRARINDIRQKEILDDEFVYSSVEDSDATSSEDEEEVERPKRKRKQKKNKGTLGKRQLGKNMPTPTLLQRLTGLTGDPNDPVYKDPKQRQKPGYGQAWAEKKKKQINKLKKERDYAEALDHTDEFKKLCLTLVLASSMSGEDGVVNWSIVEKVYFRDKFLDLLKFKKLWTWMQTHMTAQLADLVDTLQSNILAAYEARKLPTIDDPEVYDWAGLVRWSMRICKYPEFPLPLYREALAQFGVDESHYSTVDRVSWYSKKIADATRTHLQLQLSFVTPLHEKQSQGHAIDDNILKARSWTRANIATVQSQYDANQAHEKLKVLGEDTLIKVVSDYVQEEHLKMRKLKRQLPGRNYTFTKKFAKLYKRPFELEDFMVAITVKKELDTAFSDEDSEKRFYSISSCEEDGSIMAIMSLVADGKVKLIPRLPPVNDEFGAPLPRLSKWGFCEGDYIHRAIDRNRLSWETHVVPTSGYQFGSPLHPLPSPAADWPSLPEPPLPGKHDANALLPIWSSIDGQTVTWPWWYRILNLVLQPLFLQPGATAIDVFSHCAEHTTELFEVELVLGWLDSVGAIFKIIGGGYQASSHFWAAFGDRLLDTEDDWFGEHVKRRNKITTKQQWRDKYNLRYSKMQTSSLQAGGNEREQSSRKTRGGSNAMSQRISGNAKAQYSIIQQALLEPVPEEDGEAIQETGVGRQTPTTAQEATSGELQMPDAANTAVQDELLDPLFLSEDANAVIQEEVSHALPAPDVANTPVQDQDVDMVDADADMNAEGEDEDAEGEIDDAMY